MNNLDHLPIVEEYTECGQILQVLHNEKDKTYIVRHKKLNKVFRPCWWGYNNQCDQKSAIQAAKADALYCIYEKCGNSNKTAANYFNGLVEFAQENPNYYLFKI